MMHASDDAHRATRRTRACVRRDSEPRLDGSAPSSRLLFSRSALSVVSAPMLAGMTPVSRFDCRFRMVG